MTYGDRLLDGGGWERNWVNVMKRGWFACYETPA